MRMLLGEAQRISGKVTGTVNGVAISDVDLHAYVITNDGRTYTAINRIPDTIGWAMQSLYPIGGILGFLFAFPQQPTLHNGFVLTGVYTNYSLSCHFHAPVHRRRSSVNFGGKTFLPENYV